MYNWLAWLCDWSDSRNEYARNKVNVECHQRKKEVSDMVFTLIENIFTNSWCLSATGANALHIWYRQKREIFHHFYGTIVIKWCWISNWNRYSCIRSVHPIPYDLHTFHTLIVCLIGFVRSIDSRICWYSLNMMHLIWHIKKIRKINWAFCANGILLNFNTDVI